MTAPARNKRRHNAEATPARQRVVAAAVAVMLVLAQVLAVSHFILVPHSISWDTGRLIHCKDADSHDRKHHGGREPHREVPGDECQVYAVMHQAAALSVCGVNVVAPMVSPDHVPLLLVESTLVSQRALFLFAPSRSPPASLA